MSSDLVKNVTFVIKQFVKEEKMFTLLDISREVQKVANTIISHTEIREYSKPIVEDVLLSSADWFTSENVTLETANGKVSAVLYFPEWEDPETYVAATKNKCITKTQPQPVYKTVAQPAPAPVTVNQSSSLPACTANARWWVFAKVRSDGKIEIPHKAIVEAGLDGGAIDVVVHPNSISIVAGYTKLANGVRVGTQALAQANLTGKQIVICAFSDKVVLCS
jgi:hypothetical protein